MPFSGTDLYQSIRLSAFAFLFGAKNSVAGIAQTRNDICVFVQAAVSRGNVDVYIRMRFLQNFDAFRCGDQAQEARIA